MIEIYGLSDDLIEVEGDISAEFYADQDGNLIILSDGTILSIEYTKRGIWRIIVEQKGILNTTIISAPLDDDKNYSDKAIIEDSPDWVAVTSYNNFARRKK